MKSIGVILAILSLGLFTSLGSSFADCVDYRDYIRLVGSTTNPQPAWDVGVYGDYAYVSNSYTGAITIMNVSDPNTPYVVNVINVGPSLMAFGVLVSGSRLYVAGGTWGVQVYDLSNPMFPSLLGNVPNPNLIYAWDIALSGSYLYVVDHRGYFRIYDISNISAPITLGSVTLPGLPYSLELSGNRAYIADDQGGLQIVDVSNPASPVIVGSTSIQMAAYGVALSGSYALVADHKFGLRVISISNPASPVLAASVQMPGPPNGPYGIAVSGTYAFVSDEFTGLTVFDISDPVSPEIVGSVRVPDAYQKGRYLAVSGSHVFVAGQGFHAIDIATPTSPFVGSLSNPSPNAFQEMAVSGAYGYATDFYSGFKVINISDSEHPSIVGSLFTMAPRGVAVAGTRAYVTDSYGLRYVDISNPASPSMTFSLEISGSRALSVSDGYAFVTCTAGVKVIDVSNYPTEVATVSVPEFPCQHIVVSGSHAYVTGGKALNPPTTGLRVVDISNPLSPVIVGGLTFSSGGWGDLDVEGTYLYAATASGVQVVDISSPSSPAVVATLGPYPAHDVSVSGAYGYVSNYYGLSVINMSDPQLPTVMATMAVPGDNFGLVTSDSYAYVLANLGMFISPLFCVGPCTPHVSFPNGGEHFITGMQASIRWDNPTLERCVVSYAELYYSSDGGGSWNFVADHLSGNSYVWGVPQTPTQNGRLRVVMLDETGVIGEDMSDGNFEIASPTGVGERIPAVTRLYQNAPNPFEEATRIAFDVTTGGKVALDVFDLSGRKVGTLADGWYPAGHHEVAWDGRDEVGRAIAGGIYFLRMKAGSFTDTKRMYIRR